MVRASLASLQPACSFAFPLCCLPRACTDFARDDSMKLDKGGVPEASDCLVRLCPVRVPFSSLQCQSFTHALLADLCAPRGAGACSLTLAPPDLRAAGSSFARMHSFSRSLDRNRGMLVVWMHRICSGSRCSWTRRACTVTWPSRPQAAARMSAKEPPPTGYARFALYVGVRCSSSSVAVCGCSPLFA